MILRVNLLRMLEIITLMHQARIAEIKALFIDPHRNSLASKNFKMIIRKSRISTF